MRFAEKALRVASRSRPRCTHTLDLPLGNRTPDSAIVDIAERENRLVVTKDDDFVQSHLISGHPPKLLLIATGNISNAELEAALPSSVVDQCSIRQQDGSYKKPTQITSFGIGTGGGDIALRNRIGYITP